ncbi:flagellar hook-associated protein FlgK [Pseudoroseomonas rhizosphaerae]|uniref:Flagellar hook-associated protein 1 n=1 Tax=Teichococcus rhizosphaerae TaxID=1335062 RepID=A0A2C6XYT0_9PROT|nr:flagellar hook-associated protein FlgK [Pseudoroseomonas rhizosphaerae]PHK93692.1 flagellar hook-associated protein FlgK [Pseudoroseomonas rhizosphaerae]
MTISAALSNALSSLAAEQRQSMILANNIANANTPGYVRRDMPRSEQLVAGVGSGVMAGATQRAGDAALAAASRMADGMEAYAGRMREMLEAYNATVGQPSDERSLSSKLGSFKEAMTTLSSAPDNAVAQAQALAAAQDLVEAFHAMDSAISEARAKADLSVAQDVEAVNAALGSLAEMDRQMAVASARGASTAEFEDRRDTLLADISGRLPLRVFDNGPGHLLLMTDGGTTLYDSTVIHPLSFTHTPTMPAESRHPAALSAVTVEGQALRMSDSGSIAASLQLRDVTLPRFTDMIDQVAARLIQSFQEADTTLSGQQAGLFAVTGEADWDAGAPFLGLSRKIAINPAADPEQGGALSALRAGMHATPAMLEGQAADNTVILRALDALEKARAYGGATGLPSSMSLSQAASQSIGLMQGERAIWSDRAEARGRLALQAREDLTNKTAVNIDEEMQRLLVVQQTYAASVQVIQAAARMLEQLEQIR